MEAKLELEQIHSSSSSVVCHNMCSWGLSADKFRFVFLLCSAHLFQVPKNQTLYLKKRVEKCENAAGDFLVAEAPPPAAR